MQLGGPSARRCPAASQRQQVGGGCGSPDWLLLCVTPACQILLVAVQPAGLPRAPGAQLRPGGRGERACHRLLPSEQHHRCADNALGGCRAGHGHLAPCRAWCLRPDGQSGRCPLARRCAPTLPVSLQAHTSARQRPAPSARPSRSALAPTEAGAVGAPAGRPGLNLPLG